MTTSTFTSDAFEAPKELKDQKLVLIDGIRFVKLMIEYSVGVQVKETIKVLKLDQYFFAIDD